MVTTVVRCSRLGELRLVGSMLVGCGVAIVSTLVYFAWSNTPTRQVKIAEIIGQADNQVFIDRQPVQPGAILSLGQQILTLQSARVGLQQEGQVLARLGTQSSAILESDCIQLAEGQLVVSSTSGCLGAAVFQSQTGIFVLERVGTLGEVNVLSGEVRMVIPSNPALGVVTLKENQKLTFSLTGDEIGPVRLMLPSEVNRIAESELFQGFRQAIAQQQAIAGLIPPLPSPSPSVAPTPRQPLPRTQPPLDKVPTAAPPAPPPAARPASTPALPTSHTDDDWQADYDDSNPPATKSYPSSRSPRRRRPVAPPPETYSYRRKWTPRSSYSSTYLRRRSPAYSAPPAAAPTHPAPTPDLPTVPEVTVPELPTPIDLPPATPSTSTEPLPSPGLVEPPLEAPQ